MKKTKIYDKCKRYFLSTLMKKNNNNKKQNETSNTETICQIRIFFFKNNEIIKLTIKITNIFNDCFRIMTEKEIQGNHLTRLSSMVMKTLSH